MKPTDLKEEAKKVTLTASEAQAILNYLATKPYAEVFQLVEILRNVKVE
jgi:hypothetical protein